MDSLPEMEKIVLKGMMADEKIARVVAPYVKKEYFETHLSKQIFSYFESYFNQYNSCPPKDVILTEIEGNSLFNEQQYADAKEMVNDIYSCDISKYDEKWLISKTEKWCQDRAMINAVYESISIIDGSDKKRTTHSIPDMMREALSVTFDNTIGHDYTLDTEDRFNFYHDVTQKYAFDLSMMNQITGGGIPRKTLNIVMAPTGGGKSQFLCHIAAGYIKLGLNVLYISCEMEEKRIAERIDANIMDMRVEDLIRVDQKKYQAKVDKYLKKIMGRMIIKEYPAASSNVNHLRKLLQELKTKKNFIPDVIIVDYLNLMNSARFSGGKDSSYTTVKATAEELRGLAQEEEIMMWSATQTNRNGLNSTDLSLENTAESIGLPFTADFMFALIPIEELEQKNQILATQLKNRYGPLDPNRKFILGLDRSRMKFYDVVDSANQGLAGNAFATKQDESSRGLGFGAEQKNFSSKFDGVDFD